MYLPALLASFTLLSCSRAGRFFEQPQQVMEGFSLSQAYRGSSSWFLKSPKAVLREDQGLAIVSFPAMKFYKNQKPISLLSSRLGLVRLASQDMTLVKSVVVRSLEDGSMLETESLEYSSKKNKFFTDKEVIVTRPGARLRGSGLEASPDFSQVKIFKQKTVIQDDKISAH